MADIFGSIQGLIYLAFWAVAMGLSVFGLVDALRHRPDAFTAAGKASKNLWLAVLGGAIALSIVSFPNPFQITGILAVVRRGRLCSGRAPRAAPGDGARVLR